jgi:hypothetical protein
MKFCCDRFKNYYERGEIYEGDKLVKEIYPKIKIVKIEADKYNNGVNLFRFYFVAGFLKDRPPVINMKYCPFCGKNLFNFYKSDLYINGRQEVFDL